MPQLSSFEESASPSGMSSFIMQCPPPVKSASLGRGSSFSGRCPPPVGLAASLTGAGGRVGLLWLQKGRLLLRGRWGSCPASNRVPPSSRCLPSYTHFRISKQMQNLSINSPLPPQAIRPVKLAPSSLEKSSVEHFEGFLKPEEVGNR